eukprot:UN07313
MKFHQYLGTSTNKCTPNVLGSMLETIRSATRLQQCVHLYILERRRILEMTTQSTRLSST